MAIQRYNKPTYEIIKNVNIGIRVNKIFTNFCNVKTNTQFIRVLEQIKKFKVGSYKEINILGILENFDFIPRTYNEKDFISVIKRVYSGDIFYLFKNKTWMSGLTKMAEMAEIY